MVISKVVNYFLMSQLTFSQSFWSFLIITGLSEQHQLLTGPDGGPNAYYTSFDAYILGSFSSYSIFDNFSVSFSEKLPKFKKEHQKIYRETRSIAVIEIVSLLFEIKFETVGLIFALYIKATRGMGCSYTQSETREQREIAQNGQNCYCTKYPRDSSERENKWLL